MGDAGDVLDIVQRILGGCLKDRNTAENEVTQLSLIEALAENIIIDPTVLSLWEYSHRLGVYGHNYTPYLSSYCMEALSSLQMASQLVPDARVSILDSQASKWHNA